MYDEQIKYYSDEAWRKYFNVDLAQLYSSVEGLLTLRDIVVQQISDKTVGDLIKESDLWKSVFFGGFTANGSEPYSENALAKFYNECFEIGMENPSLVISRLKEGLSLESASEDVRCRISDEKGDEENSVVETLRRISSNLKAIYKELRNVVDKPKAKEYSISDPYFGVKAMKDVLNAGKRLLPLYNPLSFFIISVYSIPRFYAREAYPKLFEDGIEVLDKYDIRIGKLLEPDLPDEKVRREREIVGLKEEGSVGLLLREVILDIYSLFQLSSLRKFFTLEDEFAKFVKINVGKLKESIVVDQFMNVINVLRDTHWRTEYLDDKERCKVPKPFEFYYSFTYGENPDYRGKVVGGEVIFSFRGEKLNYTEFVAFMAPIMFLGLAYMRPVSEKEFVWCCLLGWEG